jgi:hypothetical protein
MRWDSAHRRTSLKRSSKRKATSPVLSGDEVMAVFPSAKDALQAAIDMHLAISELPTIAGLPMSLRIGVRPALARVADFAM